MAYIREYQGGWRDAEEKEHATVKQLISFGVHAEVIGNIPLGLIREASILNCGPRVYGIVQIPFMKGDQRGRELSLSELIEAGFRIDWWTVLWTGRQLGNVLAPWYEPYSPPFSRNRVAPKARK